MHHVSVQRPDAFLAQLGRLLASVPSGEGDDEKAKISQFTSFSQCWTYGGAEIFRTSTDARGLGE